MNAPYNKNWAFDSWQQFPALQQPKYENPDELWRVVELLRSYPPLVYSGEVERLKQRIADAGRGRAFILQGGDCAERFVDCNPNAITSKIKILLQMSLILIYGTKLPVVRIGRIAGQYAKPRSNDREITNGLDLPVFRGDNVNAITAESKARQPQPQRLIIGHHSSAMTLNFIRALLDGGFADLNAPEHWNLKFFANETIAHRYADLMGQIKDAISFVRSIGASKDESINSVAFYTSHEGLLLPYEMAMTRRVPVRNNFYDLSAHMLWIGDRTKQIDGAHVEFFRGIANPIGIKVGPKTDFSELVETLKRLNPSNEPGRITLIARFGVESVEAQLPQLIAMVKKEKLFVTWQVDPMHGNVITTTCGIKTRDFSSMLKEVELSYKIHTSEKSILGGLHFEMTGDNVTECIGGAEGLTINDLTKNYESYCDPRLNYGQSLEMAFRVAEMFQKL